MIRHSLIIGLVFSIVAIGRADDGVKAQRFLVMLRQGPLVLDLAINIDGKPLGDERQRIVRELIAGADVNRDGKTTWAEAADGEHFKIGQLKYLAQENPKSFRRRLKMFDEVENGVVDHVEASRLWALYTGAEDLISFTSSAYYQSIIPTTPLLFACLDDDKDSVLSAQELANGSARLLALDVNDNQLFDYQELTRFTEQARTMGATIAQDDSASILHVDDSDPEFLLGQFRAIYSTEKEDAQRPPLYRQFIKQLDSNRDGILDTDEFAAITTMTAHLDLEVHLGTHDVSRPCKLRAISPEFGDAGSVVVSGSALAVELDSLRLQFLLTQRIGALEIESQLQSMFRTLDGDSNGYLELAEVEMDKDDGRAAEFTSWDLNDDGKVMLDELTGYHRQIGNMQRRSVALTSVPKGRSLWNVADTNADGRLSLREINSIQQRIMTCDVNKDKQITPDEMPSTVSIRLLPGAAEIPILQRPFGMYQQVTIAPAGPVWFIRMDRNGDGDISRREFLGDLEQFRAYDKNQDGLIDPDEATTGDKKK